jgi:hypothetical protein
LGEKVVNDLLEMANDNELTADQRRRMLRDAFNTQMQFNEFLFNIGELNKEPDKMEIEGDAGEAYMEMLKQYHSEGN